MSLLKRFWSKIDKSDSCWTWKGYKDRDGYGQFSKSHTETARAHRFSYELLKGNIPVGLTIDHLCRNRACVNPTHLEVVTIKENLERGKPNSSRLNSLKTHCPRGHPLIGENLYLYPNKRHRECRECNRKRCIDRYYKRKNKRW